VWPVFVVVRHVARQHRPQLSPAQDQHPVQQLTTDGADPPFGERVRPRRPHRRAQDPDALGAEDRIEAIGELRVPVVDEEPELPDAVPKVHDEVAGLLGYPRSRRVRRHPQDVDAAGGDLEHEQHVQAPEQHRVDVEEVARQQALGLSGQELPPRQPRAARRRIDAGAFEQQPDGARRHLVPELHEFTVDPAVAPGRVVRRHPQDQAPQLRGCRRPAGWTVGTRPAATDQGSMPAQQGVRGDQAMRSALPSEESAQRRQDGPVWPGRTRSGDLSAQHGDVVSQHEQLCVLEVCPRASSASQPRS
jgi:hypothetical protein